MPQARTPFKDQWVVRCHRLSEASHTAPSPDATRAVVPHQRGSAAPRTRTGPTPQRCAATAPKRPSPAMPSLAAPCHAMRSGDVWSCDRGRRGIEPRCNHSPYRAFAPLPSHASPRRAKPRLAKPCHDCACRGIEPRRNHSRATAISGPCLAVPRPARASHTLPNPEKT